MTTSKILAKFLTSIRRTTSRIKRALARSSTTLTVSIPPFFKLEVKTEPQPARKIRRRRGA